MSTNLRKAAYPVFGQDDIYDGEACFREGRIENFVRNGQDVIARIGRGQLYHAGLSIDAQDVTSPKLVGVCECDDYHYDGTCMHLWALMMHCDQHGFLQEAKPTAYYPAYAEEIMERKLFQDTPSKPETSWNKQLASIKDVLPVKPPREIEVREAEIELVLYPDYFDVQSLKIYLELLGRIRRKNGVWGEWKPIHEGGLPRGLPEVTRDLAAHVMAFSKFIHHYASWRDYRTMELQQALYILPRFFENHGAVVMFGTTRFGGLIWDASEPWHFELELQEKEEIHQFQAHGLLCRGDETIIITPDNLSASSVSGWAVLENRLIRIENVEVAPWLNHFSDAKTPLVIPADEAHGFVETILKRKTMPVMRLPETLQYEMVSIQPVPVLNIHPNARGGSGNFLAGLEFDYEGARIISTVASATVSHRANRKIMRRNKHFEEASALKLQATGLIPVHSYVDTDPRWRIAQSRIPDVVRTLHEAGWMIIAEGKPMRASKSFSVSVKSGTDWFDLEVSCDFDGPAAALPDLLEALKQRKSFILLGDGSIGMLPEEWLRKFGGIADLGEVEGNAIRFRPNQSLLLDAWLSAMPEAKVDEIFARTRERIAESGRLTPAKAPRGFKGELRPYQREGLSWLECLQRLELGGCLADDMGLGKTVQVLALLAGRRTRHKKEKRPPSLVVVPKSLIYNWMREAERFAPKLKVIDYTGVTREVDDKADVLLTTYGILRRDIETLKEIVFDYIILDESTAIKNAGAQTAKAVRLLRGQHRLAMSGTPVENHIGELWSLFEFLNPGMLGKASPFRKQFNRDVAPEQRALLGRALRPFILRRTKRQVAKDLPERQEDTLYCELPEQQRKFYDELRNFYRARLLKKVQADGLNKSKIMVLEALLRLRQAACHHGLIDADFHEAPCAKFETLLPQLAELAEEGHKALIFSQFTGYLALLQNELAKRGFLTEYLDGQTQDRQARIDRFQSSPDCPFFLISLKAGGVGLNLTAADYVFLLDPWWNPAVEAQAIDRAHRIGQTRKVMAYRLIAQDTVEEKVLALQDSKRDLADAILSEDNAVLRNLTAEDLAFLLG